MSEHGTGKSLLAEWFANDIIGINNHALAKNMGDLLSHFDGNLENKIITILDEVGEHGSMWNDEAMLKSLITRTVNSDISVRVIFAKSHLSGI